MSKKELTERIEALEAKVAALEAKQPIVWKWETIGQTPANAVYRTVVR
jgi:BMFP domain-containing protein YqiC